MLSAPFASAEASKFDAAFQRKGRSGLGFSSTAVSPPTDAKSTEASRLLLSSSSSPSSASSFSAHAYLQRFGWKAGGGLGKKEDGAQSFLRVSKKADAAGIGAGVAAQAVARSFDSLYNNAARSITVIIQPSSDEDEDAARPSESSADAAMEKWKRKKDKKRKRRHLDSASSDESNQLPSAPRIDERKDAASSSSPTATSPHSHLHRAFRRGAEVLFAEASESCISTPSNPAESAAAFAGDLLESHDTERSHLYHDRCQGKLARIRAQEERQHEIVEQIRSKRWASSDERKDTPTSHHESKTERRERRRTERDLRHSRADPSPSPHSFPAQISSERKRQKRDKQAPCDPP